MALSPSNPEEQASLRVGISAAKRLSKTETYLSGGLGGGKWPGPERQVSQQEAGGEGGRWNRVGGRIWGRKGEVRWAGGPDKVSWGGDRGGG